MKIILDYMCSDKDRTLPLLEYISDAAPQIIFTFAIAQDFSLESPKDNWSNGHRLKRFGLSNKQTNIFKDYNANSKTQKLLTFFLRKKNCQWDYTQCRPSFRLDQYWSSLLKLSKLYPTSRLDMISLTVEHGFQARNS